MELQVAVRELDWGGAMLCLLRCPAGEDDIDRLTYIQRIMAQISLEDTN